MEMKEQAAQPVDPFGLNADFDVDGDASQLLGSQAPPQPSPAITKEFNFGGGPITITATTQDELLDKALAAKEQYILSQVQQPEEYVEPPSQDDYRIPELSTEEEQLMALEWAKNPSGHVKRIIEAELGIPFAEFKKEFKEQQDFRTTVYLHKIGAEFANRHPEYYGIPQNADKILNFLIRTGRNFTPENYEFAYANIPKNEFIPAPQGEDAAPAAGSMSTALSGSYGNVPYETDANGMSVDEYARKLEQMPLADLEKLINSSRGR